MPLGRQKSPRSKWGPSKQKGTRSGPKERQGHGHSGHSHSHPGSTTMFPGALWSLTEPSRTGSLGVPFTAGTVGR